MSDPSTEMLEAIQESNISKIMSLVDMDGKIKFDPNTEIKGYTPIYYAIQAYIQKAKAAKKVIQFLVSDIQLNEPGNENNLGASASGKMPLDLIDSSSDDITLKEFLTTLKLKANTGSKPIPEDAIISAIENLNLPEVNQLIASGIDPTKEFEDATPIYYALMQYPSVKKTGDSLKLNTLKEIIKTLVLEIRKRYPGTEKENNMGAGNAGMKPIDYFSDPKSAEFKDFLCELGLKAAKFDNECRPAKSGRGKRITLRKKQNRKHT